MKGMFRVTSKVGDSTYKATTIFSLQLARLSKIGGEKDRINQTCPESNISKASCLQVGKSDPFSQDMIKHILVQLCCKFFLFLQD